MANSSRKSGIDVIRHIAWGTHLCQFYQTKEDLIDILVPYFKAGLYNNEFCMWVTSEPLGVKEATASLGKAVRDLDGYIAKGQLEILDYSQWYTKSGKFDADEVLQGWVDKEKMALEKGFSGLRLTGNTFWLDPGDWKSFYDYEAMVNSVIGSHRMIAICTYSLDKCGAPEILDVISNHEFALIRREGVWVAIESAERSKIDQRWRSLVANAPNIIMILGRDGTIQFINHTVSGLEVEEVIGKSIFDYIQPKYHDIARETNSRVFETGKTGKYEIKGTGPDGRTSWYETDIGPIKDGQLVTSIMQITSDITERKQMEDSLHESQSRLEIAIEALESGIWELNVKTGEAWRSLRHDQIFGYTTLLPEWTYQMFLDHVIPEDRSEVAKKYGYALSTETEWDFECRINRVDKTVRWIWAKGKPNTYDDKNEVVLMTGIIRDITERKQAEEREKQLQNDLHATSRLATVGEMAAGISHEINNPLTGVVGFSDLLLKKDLPEDIKKDISIIHEGAQRIASIIDRMLRFARQTKSERTQVNINDIIEATLTMRASEMRTGNIKVASELAPDLPLTSADAGLLQHAFLNIILNAEMAMKLAHRKGKLTVKTERIDNTIRVSFKDDGSGIAKENLEKIFNPFFTTQGPDKGTGLGLSICYSIVTQHDGKIYAESTLGKGATFFVELPIVDKGEQLKLDEPVAGESKSKCKASILVVDDDPTVQEFITAVLTEEGHEVEIVDNGNDAMEKLSDEEYDVILLDIKLPGMSGIEIYEQLQISSKSLTGKVIFITGDVMSVDTMDFIKSAQTSYIAKPFDAAQLLKEIDRIINQWSLWNKYAERIL
ncbi:MEDS domain-containing protein [Chloroflexota bacterium]